MSGQSQALVVASGVMWWHGWKWSGSFTALDLLAALTNALNGALLARRPDHYRNFTVLGIMFMALLMGLGGGITRDVLLNKIPDALANPAYIVVALVGGVLGYALAHDSDRLFREGLFQFVTSLALPLYAITGAQAAVKAGLPVLGILAIAAIAPTAGHWYVDVSCGVPPKQFIRNEWYVTVALFTGLFWVICDSAGLAIWASYLAALVVGYSLRMLALYNAWEEPLARAPTGVHVHDDHPFLGRKLKGKSQRQIATLGLTVREPDDSQAEE